MAHHPALCTHLRGLGGQGGHGTAWLVPTLTKRPHSSNHGPNRPDVQDGACRHGEDGDPSAIAFSVLATLAIAVFGLVYAALAAMGQTSSNVFGIFIDQSPRLLLDRTAGLGQPSMGEPSMQTAKTFALGGSVANVLHGLVPQVCFTSRILESRLQKPCASMGLADCVRSCPDLRAGWASFCLHWIARLERVYRGVSHLSGVFASALGLPWLTTSIIDHSLLSLEISAACFHGKSDPESDNSVIEQVKWP